MKQMLFRYYQQELSAWILFTPLVASFFALPLLFERAELASLFILSITISVLCSLYLDLRERQLIMTSLFPISKKTFFFVDISFIGRYTLYYILYTMVVTTIFQTLLEQQLILPSAKQILLSIVISLLIISIFLLLRRIKYGYYVNLSMFFIPLAFTQLISLIVRLSTFHSILLFFSSLVLIIIAARITYVREQRRDIT
ncbi:ATPase [Solibacillus sp. A46]|uniref:ATPase n=1 Tax=Solibacillus faecavium TaxID=2762221 RepID=A0ABR8XTX6_9BACL|nr:ATPase [Solibacillus faecavium]MBD8035378.1 ATPase [Solibacillus faecavium]